MGEQRQEVDQMQSIQEQLMQEINRTPEKLLQQVLVFLQFLNQTYTQKLSDSEDEWPPGFFEEVIGSWEGEKLVRAPQPEYPNREELR
jgi:hypothetical protein